MKKRVFVLGSGKMAQNIGLLCLRFGYDVTWLTSTIDRALYLQQQLLKKYKRFDDAIKQETVPPHVTYYTDTNISMPDIILEATRENLSIKKKAFAMISHLITSRTQLYTTSSSIFPSNIHPDCIGIHFFYPVELTAFAEIIVPSQCPISHKENAIAFAKSLQCSFIVQSEQNAFAVNRLLLPLQVEAVRLITEGADPALVDKATVSDFLPFGQLAFMDSVGLDTILESVKSYMSIIPLHEKNAFDDFVETLQQMVDSNCLGNKNSSGFMSNCTSMANSRQIVCPQDFIYLFINTCYCFLEQGQLSLFELDHLLEAVYNAEISFEQAVSMYDRQEIGEWCKNKYQETGIYYFKPSVSYNSSL